MELFENDSIETADNVDIYVKVTQDRLIFCESGSVTFTPGILIPTGTRFVGSGQHTKILCWSAWYVKRGRMISHSSRSERRSVSWRRAL